MSSTFHHYSICVIPTRFAPSPARAATHAVRKRWFATATLAAALLAQAGALAQAQHLLGAGTNATPPDPKPQDRSAGEVSEALELANLNRRVRAGETLSDEDASRREVLLQRAVAWRESMHRFQFSLRQQSAGSGQADVQSQTRLRTWVAQDPSGAVGLHYVVTNDRVGIIVNTAGGSFGRFSTVARAELNRQIVALRQAIVAKADTRAPAQALWQMLIAPVQADIAASGAKTLVLSLTDTLRYLPFAALQDGTGRYLIEDYALGHWIAAAGDAPSRQAFHRGEGSRIDRVLRGSCQDAPDIRIVIPGHKEPIMGLTQLSTRDFSDVDQLTLLGCSQTMGSLVSDSGADQEGFVAVALSTGARSVLTTFWSPGADAESLLLRDMHARVERQSIASRAQALQQAQLGLLRGLIGSPATNPSDAQRAARAIGPDGQPIASSAALPFDPKRPWAHPYYWAPFVLSGSWL